MNKNRSLPGGEGSFFDWGCSLDGNGSGSGQLLLHGLGHGELQDAVLVMRDNGLFVIFEEPQRGITPGQFAVWYDRDEMIGSGVI